MMTKKINEKNAKQGEQGKPVLKVLIAGLILAVVAMGGYLLWVGERTPMEDMSITDEVGITDPADPENPVPTADEAGSRDAD